MKQFSSIETDVIHVVTRMAASARAPCVFQPGASALPRRGLGEEVPCQDETDIKDQVDKEQVPVPADVAQLGLRLGSKFAQRVSGVVHQFAARQYRVSSSGSVGSVV